MKRVSLAVASALALSGILTGCGSSGGSADTNLTNISGAMNPPTLGGAASREEWTLTAEGIPQRVSGKACKYAVNAWRRLASLTRRAKRHSCQFGQLETNGSVTAPASGYNYYEFPFKGLDIRMRYGTSSNGTKIASFCESTNQYAEVAVVKSGSTATVTITDNFALKVDGDTEPATHQAIITANVGDTITFQSATGQTFSANTFAGAFSLSTGTAAGGFNEFRHAYFVNTGAKSLKTYAQFNTTIACTKVDYTSTASGHLTFTHVCGNDNDTACVTGQTTQSCYAPVNADTLATPTLPTAAPSRIDTWDCNAPAGTTFTQITFTDLKQAAKDAVTKCHADNGGTRDDDDFTEVDVSTGGDCTGS